MSRKTPTNVNGGVYNAVSPVFTDGSFVAFQFDVNGNLLTTGGGGGGGNASVALVGGAVPTSATMIGWDDGSGNVQFVSAGNPLPITGSISATNPSVGSTGATAPTSATLLGVVVAGNLQPVSATYPVRVDPTGTTTQPVSFGALPAGSNLIGQVEVSDGTNVLFTSGHPGYVQGTLATTSGQTSESTGTINSGSGTGSLVALSVVGYSTVTVTLNGGIVSGTGSLAYEVSDTVGGTNWYGISGWSPSSPTTGLVATTALSSSTANLALQFNVSGWNQFRVRVVTNSIVTGSVNVGVIAQSGTAAIAAISAGILQVSPTTAANSASNPFATAIIQGSTPVSSAAPLQVSLANTGANGTAIAVSGTFWQATQPVSGTFWQATQPVSLASLPALASGTNTIGAVEITDGTNGNAAVKAASTAAAGADKALVVAINPLSQSQVIGEVMDSTGVMRAVVQATFASATSGAHSIVAGSGSLKVYVLSWAVSISATACSVNLQSHTTTSNASMTVYGAINGGAVFPRDLGTYLITTAGEGLDFNLSASQQISGTVTYAQF